MPKTKDKQVRMINLPLQESLTPRERQVAELLLTDHRIRQIADILGVSPKTVKMWTQEIREKAGHVSSSVVAAHRLLCSPPPSPPATNGIHVDTDHWR